MPGGNWWNPIDDAQAVLSSAEHLAQQLIAEGIPDCGPLRFFITLFEDAGEDSLDGLRRLYSAITSHGLDFVTVLEGLAEGCQRAGGPLPFAQHVTRALAEQVPPWVNAAARALFADVEIHQDLLRALDTKLTDFAGFATTAPNTGTGAGGTASQGASAPSRGTTAFVSRGLTQDAFNARYAGLKQNITSLTASLSMSASSTTATTAAQAGGSQPSLQEILTQFQQRWDAQVEQDGSAILVMAIIDALLLVVEAIAVVGVTVVVSAPTGEAAAIPIGGIAAGSLVLPDIVVLLVELQILSLLPILLDLIFSLIGLLLYTIGQTISQHQDLGGVHTNAAYGFPELTDEQRTLRRSLARYFKEKFGVDISEEWLDYLIGMIATTGVSIDLIRGQILCLFQKGLLSPAYSKVWNSVTHSLEPDDLQGAWKDVNGIPVVKGGRSYIHFDKVAQGLKPLKAIADDPNAPPALRQACQKMIDYVNSVIDRSFPRKDSQWKDQARGPFWQDLLQLSGCSAAPAVPPGATNVP